VCVFLKNLKFNFKIIFKNKNLPPNFVFDVYSHTHDCRRPLFFNFNFNFLFILIYKKTIQPMSLSLLCPKDLILGILVNGLTYLRNLGKKIKIK